MEEDGDDDMRDLESLNYDDLDSVSKLQKTQRYKDIMQVCNRNYTQFLEHAFLLYIYLACVLFALHKHKYCTNVVQWKMDTILGCTMFCARALFTCLTCMLSKH